MRMVAIVCALIWAGVMPAAAQQAVVSQRDASACWSEEDYRAPIRMAARGDREGAIRLFKLQLISGACFPLREGETVIIEEQSFLSGMVKARRVGDVRSFWTDISFVRVR